MQASRLGRVELRQRVAVAVAAAAVALCAGIATERSTSAAAQPSALAQSAASEVNPASQRAVLDQYCVTCHNARQKARQATPIALDTLDINEVPAHADQWEKVIAKLRAGLMPPARMPRPDKATLDRLSAWIETQIDRAAAANPNPGRTESLHRLNRAEYQNAIRDLLHVDIDVASLLPADDVSAGFDNVASALTISPTLMDRYIVVAQKVSRLAVSTPAPVPNVDYFRLADDLRQDDHLPDMPLGTRGGTHITYTFPLTGEYVIKVRLARDLNEQMPAYADPQQLEVSLDGKQLQVFTLPGAARPAGRGQSSNQRVPLPSDAPAAAPAVESAQSRRPGAAQAPEGARLPATARDARNRADQAWDVHVTVTAGAHDVVAAFLNQTTALDETARMPFLRPFPAGNNVPEGRLGAALRSVEISGPYGQVAVGESASRRQIFVCHPDTKVGVQPAATRDVSRTDAACARTILLRLARRAYRRPVSADDVQPLLELYQQGRTQGSFDAGIEMAVRRLLVSPEFLYRVELDPPNVRANTSYRISDIALASRLSFFLWSSIPDEQLLDLAVEGRLSSRDVLTQQVKRMLADPRADALVKNFSGQWLFLRNVASTGPTASTFPDFDDTLRQAFRHETELFFESMVKEDRSAIDLLNGDYTFLNERLAEHYGIRTIKGSYFRRYTWPANDVRRGLLGQGSILTLTSYPDRTSPVVRGKWILENILGTPPPPPLPNVGELKPTNGTGVVLSMRERLAQHRANPICANCHGMLDPLGLALENYDAVGKWRTRDESGHPIDASAVLPDGTNVNGPDSLRAALVQRSDRFLATFTEKLLTYALGRRLEYFDMPAVRQILRQAEPGGYRLSTGIILGIVQSPTFQMRRAQS